MQETLRPHLQDVVVVQTNETGLAPGNAGNGHPEVEEDEELTYAPTSQLGRKSRVFAAWCTREHSMMIKRVVTKLTSSQSSPIWCKQSWLQSDHRFWIFFFLVKVRRACSGRLRVHAYTELYHPPRLFSPASLLVPLAVTVATKGSSRGEAV